MIAKLKICIVLFTASLLMIGCAHTVCIKVVDAETKKPLANTTFTAMIRKSSFQKEIVTDANGNFKLSNVPVGEQTLIIDRTGYRAAKKEGVMVNEGLVYKVDFEMIPAEEEIHQPFISPITIHSF